MRRLIVGVVAVAAVVGSSTASADITLGGRIGLPGVGIEASTKFSDYVGMRAGFGGLAYSFDFTYDDIDYDVEYRTSLGSLLLDMHPMGGKFRITAGGALYNAKASITATPSPSTFYEIGNSSYLGSAIGSLRGTVEYKKTVPYVGIGFDFMAQKKSGFGVTFDAGVYYLGKPTKVSLTSTGTVSPTDLSIEQNNIEDDASSYDIALGVGLYYRF